MIHPKRKIRRENVKCNYFLFPFLLELGGHNNGGISSTVSKPMLIFAQYEQFLPLDTKA